MSSTGMLISKLRYIMTNALKAAYGVLVLITYVLVIWITIQFIVRHMDTTYLLNLFYN